MRKIQTIRSEPEPELEFSIFSHIKSCYPIFQNFIVSDSA